MTLSASASAPSPSPAKKFTVFACVLLLVLCSDVLCFCCSCFVLTLLTCCSPARLSNVSVVLICSASLSAHIALSPRDPAVCLSPSRMEVEFKMCFHKWLLGWLNALTTQIQFRQCCVGLECLAQCASPGQCFLFCFVAIPCKGERMAWFLPVGSLFVLLTLIFEVCLSVWICSWMT